MPQLDWNVILTGLLYAALTGIFNLLFARKSQIEAWAESRPRLAAILKLSRSLGFDPWNALSALSLLFAKKLPEIQKADSKIAKIEQRKADEKRLGPTSIIPPGSLVVLLVALAAMRATACASVPITTKRCSFDNPEYTAHVAVCRQQIEAECLLNPDGTPVESCPALMRCEAWRKEQCQ